ARLDHVGIDPADALAEAVAVIDNGLGHPAFTALAMRLRTITRRLADPRLPAWLRTVQPVDHPQWRPYLDARAELIRRRVDALTEAAASARPAWTDHLGEEPSEPAEHEQWLRHLTTMAAYRDQYQVTDNDPDHPLGPYPERGRVGHRAYWIAAASLLALRGTGTNTDPSWGRLAADRYRTLERDEQTRIATELAGQLGPDWLGDVRDPAADADQLLYRGHLAAVLVENGHLDEPGSGLVDDRTVRAPRAPGRTRQRRDRQGRTAKKRPRPAPGLQQAEASRRQPKAPLQCPPQAPPEQPHEPRPGR
ncbi:MAG: hypothetical protein ACRDRL_20825, partial [Sciscionella sp.]